MILWDTPVWSASHAGSFLPHKLIMQKVERSDKKSTLALRSPSPFSHKVFREAVGGF